MRGGGIHSNVEMEDSPVSLDISRHYDNDYLCKNISLSLAHTRWQQEIQMQTNVAKQLFCEIIECPRTHLTYLSFKILIAFYCNYMYM